MSKHHGFCKTKLYHIWRGIKQRCDKPYNKRYKNYGGRGIIYCKEWADFLSFRNWALNNGYNKELTIDRINNDGNYEPDNCRWVTITENNRNNSHTKLTFEKAQEIRAKHTPIIYTRKQLAKEYGVSEATIKNVLNNKKYWRSQNV
jgi:DNA-binding XRE family transcriptional regulator